MRTCIAAPCARLDAAHHLRYWKVHSARADFSPSVGIHNTVRAGGCRAMQHQQFRSLLQVVGGAPEEHLLRGFALGKSQGPHDMSIATVKPQQLACTC